MKALISVSDKTGIVEFAQALHQLGVQLISTGGTAQLLSAQGLPVQEVAELTGFPEMLDGRVKTLHPMVHGALLARRDMPSHMQALQAHGIETIDLLVVNLYPFEATVAAADCSLEEAIENIDIGGPAMVRSAAKNWKHVAVVTDASQYAMVLNELQQQNGVTELTRFQLAVSAFNRISQYDGAISDYLSSLDLSTEQRSIFPGQANGRFIKTARQLQGKELSYNNIADADAAWECVKSFDSPACVIVKHANPCGVGLAEDALGAYRKAYLTDPTSAFGGIIAFNCPVDTATAQALGQQFVEVLMAPSFTGEALQLLQTKANVRVLQIALPPGGDDAWSQGLNAIDVKRIGSGLLMQTADNHLLRLEDMQVVTKLQPSPAQMQDLLFAWKVAKFVKSNAIVFAGNGMTLGVGAGQMSRLDSARMAGIKAGHANLSLKDSVVASDAFFPFRDGLDVVVDEGASCVIQPGGSMRDAEVIAAADERGVSMVFTGVRHFRH